MSGLGAGAPRYGGSVATAEEGAKLNQSVRKAITLLRATAEDSGANVSSLARAAGLPRGEAARGPAAAASVS